MCSVSILVTIHYGSRGIALYSSNIPERGERGFRIARAHRASVLPSEIRESIRPCTPTAYANIQRDLRDPLRSVWPRLKSVHEIKWNRPGNCSLLFRALISRRRYRESFLQRWARGTRPAKKHNILLTGQHLKFR